MAWRRGGGGEGEGSGRGLPSPLGRGLAWEVRAGLRRRRHDLPSPPGRRPRRGGPGAQARLPAPTSPPPRRRLPSRPAPPSPTSGAGCALRARGSLGEPPCPPTAEGDLMLDCFLRGHRFPSFSGPPPPKPSRVPGAEFTYSRSSPGFHYFGDFLTLHIEKATDLIPVSYPPSLP